MSYVFMILIDIHTCYQAEKVARGKWGNFSSFVGTISFLYCGSFFKSL